MAAVTLEGHRLAVARRSGVATRADGLVPRLAVGRIGRSFVGPSCVFASCWAAGRMSVIDRAGVVLAAGTFPIRSSLGVEVTARIRGARGSYHGLQGSGGG